MSEFKPKSALLVLRILHLAMINALILFGVVAYVLTINGKTTPEPNPVLTYLPLFLLLPALGLGNILFRNVLTRGLGTNPDLKRKLSAFQSAAIVRAGLFEFPGLFGAAMLIVTGSIESLGATVVAILVIGMNMPSIPKLQQVLELTPEEVSALKGTSTR